MVYRTVSGPLHRSQAIFAQVAPNGVLVAEPERALLEMLNTVGVQQGIEEARNIMEGARALRADALATLLQHCQRVAQEALGQNSKAVHRAYAKRALMKIPSLEDYEAKAEVTLKAA